MSTAWLTATELRVAVLSLRATAGMADTRHAMRALLANASYPHPVLRLQTRRTGRRRSTVDPAAIGDDDVSDREPLTELGAYGSDGAAPTPWAQARAGLRDAPLYWLSTVRPDGRPHVTPLLGIWLDAAAYFCTGPTERKARNLTQNRQCVLTTGRNELDGLDLVVEGEATQVDDEAELRAVAGTFETKYGAHFTAPGGTWFGLGDAIRDGTALVYRVDPTTAFGFGKGTSFSQTRWRFDQTPDRDRP